MTIPLAPLIAELGAFTVMSILEELNVTESTEFTAAVASRLPTDLPNGMEARIRTTFTVMAKLTGVRKLVLAGAELVALEAIAGAFPQLQEVTVTLPSSAEGSVARRVERNLPPELPAKVVVVPQVPEALFSPAGTVVVGLGLGGGGRVFSMVPDSVAEVLAFFKGFFAGEIVLVDPVGTPVVQRPAGWVTASTMRWFTSVVSYSDAAVTV